MSHKDWEKLQEILIWITLIGIVLFCGWLILYHPMLLFNIWGVYASTLFVLLILSIVIIIVEYIVVFIQHMSKK